MITQTNELTVKPKYREPIQSLQRISQDTLINFQLTQQANQTFWNINQSTKHNKQTVIQKQKYSFIAHEWNNDDLVYSDNQDAEKENINKQSAQINCSNGGKGLTNSRIQLKDQINLKTLKNTGRSLNNNNSNVKIENDFPRIKILSKKYERNKTFEQQVQNDLQNDRQEFIHQNKSVFFPKSDHLVTSFIVFKIKPRQSISQIFQKANQTSRCKYDKYDCK